MTHNIPIELQRYVQERIIPQYAGFDKAHQIDHVEKVIEESLKLALHYEVDSAMVYTIAAYHDLGLCEGREFHHIRFIRMPIMAVRERSSNRWRTIG